MVFKIGDRVRVIEDAQYNLYVDGFDPSRRMSCIRKGQIHIVRYVDGSHALKHSRFFSDDLVYLRGLTYGYLPQRFELVQEDKHNIKRMMHAI